MIVVTGQKGKVNRYLFSTDENVSVAKVSTLKQFRNDLDNAQIDIEGNLVIGSELESLPTFASLNLQSKQ